MRLSAALLFAIAVVVGSFTTAAAHESLDGVPAGHWRANLVSASAPAPGIRVSLLPGRVPGIFLESSAAEPVLVLGRSGEPFLRFTTAGVEANLRSPSWRENAIARGETEIAPADPESAAVWHRVSRSPRLAWIELRAWPGTDEPPPSAFHRDGVPPRRAWAIPVRVGNRTISLIGLTTWQPGQGR